MGNNPTISVIIPVKNGISTLKSCLDGIFSQSLKDSLEVIIIDSGSTDGTLDLLSEYDVKVHNLPPAEFNHGDTRNLGVKLAKGEFIVMTVQDATPVDDKWIEKMLKHFDDPLVAGVTGQQVIPHDPEKNPLQWFRPVSDPVPRKIYFPEPEKFTSLSGKEQHALCCWDDVNAMYRKSIKEKIPFQRISFSEDALWARDALSKGYAIVYDYNARVYHYHHQNYKFYFKRNYTMLYQNYKFFNYLKLPPFVLTHVLKIFYRLSKEQISFKEKVKWLFYNLKLVCAQWSATFVFFLSSKLFGIKGVEKTHKYFCGLPPQGIQAKKN